KQVGSRETKLVEQADNGEEWEHEQQPETDQDEIETAFHHIFRANALDVHRERYRKSNRRIAIHKHIRSARLRYVIHKAPLPCLISRDFYDCGKTADLRRQRSFVMPQRRRGLEHIGVIIRTVDRNK